MRCELVSEREEHVPDNQRQFWGSPSSGDGVNVGTADTGQMTRIRHRATGST